MGDDIGWMQPSIYHQGLMVGEPGFAAGLRSKVAGRLLYTFTRIAAAGPPLGQCVIIENRPGGGKSYPAPSRNA